MGVHPLAVSTLGANIEESPPDTCRFAAKIAYNFLQK